MQFTKFHLFYKVQLETFAVIFVLLPYTIGNTRQSKNKSYSQIHT